MRSLFIALAMTLVSGAARADWYQATGKHFVVYSNDDPKRIETFANQLERYDKAMRSARGVGDPPIAPAARVTVFVLPSDTDIQQLAGPNVAGFYIGRAEGPVAFVPRHSGDGSKTALDPGSVLRHEYAHHFMYTTAPAAALPGWFTEGFAEFYATTTFDADGSVMIGQAPTYRAYGLFSGPDLALRALLTTDSRKLTPDVREKMYGRGWLLVHHLAFAPNRKGQLSAYMSALNQGKSALQAADVFGDLRVLDRELDQELTARKITIVRISAARLAAEPVTMRPLTPAEAAVMRVRIRSKVGVTAKTAPAVALQARRAAAPFPTDATAQLVLTEALFDAKDYDGALGAADRVLATDPKNVRALCYKGEIAMARAQTAKATDATVWAAARKPILAANRLDPDDPQPLILFYGSYLREGRQPTGNAVTGLEHASDIAPEDLSLRFILAQAYLVQGQLKQARTALVPVAFDPHPGKRTTRAAELLAAIDTGDRAAIDKALAKPEPKEDE